MITRISIKEALELQNSIFIDTRSPREYEHDHILGAINLPLLNNEEHHEIGIIYKQISRDKAVEKGMGYYAQKIPTIHAAVKDHPGKNIIVYCARGGMRSGIISSLLDSIGFKVFQVKDGYKGFRNYMVDQLSNFQLKPKIVVLWGLTCTGKTAILKKLPNSIDMEGLAQHRGSLMGALGLKPNSQKKFENLFLQRLRELKDEKYIIVECESRRIGNVMIPDFFYKAMLKGVNVQVERSMDKRIQSMVDEYFPEMNVEEIKKIVPQFRDVISKKKKAEIIAHIDTNNYHEAARMIFEDYYDPLYNHTLKDISYSFHINSDDTEQAVQKILSNCQ